MKTKKFLLLFFLIFIICSCSIFDKNSDDSKSNTSPFEGTWKVLLDKYVFKGSKLDFVAENGNNSYSFYDKNFTYDESKKIIILDNYTTHYLIRNNQLLLGSYHQEDTAYTIVSLQKANFSSVSQFRMVFPTSNPLKETSQALLFSYYKDKDLNLDSLVIISIENLNFVPYKDTSRLVDIEITNPSSFSSLNLDSEQSITGLHISLLGYDANNEEIGNEIEWSVKKLKIKSYLYDSTNKLKAEFYDLKNSDGNTILDTLNLNIDFSNTNAFISMLKNL